MAGQLSKQKQEVPQMNIDLEKVKQMTLDKIEKSKGESFISPKRILLVAAIVAVSSALLLGAASLLDWRVVVDGKTQQGSYGDTIVVGDGFAAMSPQAPDALDDEAVMTKYPDDVPSRTPYAGELSLFAAASQDKTGYSYQNEVTKDSTLELEHIRSLAANAEAQVFLPQRIDDSYELLEGFTTFYLNADQAEKAKEVYSEYGEWKNQQVFQLSDGYDKNVRMMSYSFNAPTGDEFRIVAFNAYSSSEVYGGSGNAVIEELAPEGFERVTYVSDLGENVIHTWRKIPPIQTVNPESIGKDKRPSGNMIDIMQRPPADLLAWQSFDIYSKTLTKDELVQLVRSIDLP